MHDGDGARWFASMPEALKTGIDVRRDSIAC